MTRESIKSSIAPCGLNCEKCFAHKDGDIRRHSLALSEKLGNFGSYARRFETMLDNPVFKKYPDFKIMLDLLASENCKGCRNENCRLYKRCGVRACHQEKKVDYCFMCDEFPCDNTRFDGQFYEIWIKLNKKIKEKGIESFYESTKDASRYL